MLIPGTQMHIVTFLFVCVELVIFFYLLIYWLARPDDKTAYLNIVLIFLLILYNVTGGLLPDKKLPGSYFLQMSIAYATGFITPCFFPYYVHKAFGLGKMKFHAYKGVFFCLMLPYIIFVSTFAITGKLEAAKNLLGIPVAYALWVIITLVYAIRYKYNNDFSSKGAKEEIVVLLFSLTPWVGLPVIDFFNGDQAIEATITNIGFLTLFALQMKQHIKERREEYQRLLASEQKLLNWNTNLQAEVNKRTKELELISEQRTNTFINLAHETKTPVTLIRNYLEEYMNIHEQSEELVIVKRSIDKISDDIINLFDLEKFNKGFLVYDHNKVTDFSELVSDSLLLFSSLARKREIEVNYTIEPGVYIKADPLAINRIINNLFDNAIKYSPNKTIVDVTLTSTTEEVFFSIKDEGPGIPKNLQQKIFEPYYQIKNKKNNLQGMGLGLPIVNKVVDDVGGIISINSNPSVQSGTEIILHLNRYHLLKGEVANKEPAGFEPHVAESVEIFQPQKNDTNRQTILLVEDNPSMLNYLLKKLSVSYNAIGCINGVAAIEKLKAAEISPALIVTDVMMDKMDGFEMAKIISAMPGYNQVPTIFLTAKNSRVDRLNGLKLGAVDYISKPFYIGELIAKIESVLTVAEKQKKAVLDALLHAAGSQPEESPGTNLQVQFEGKCRFFKLSKREMEISRLISLGMAYKAIAAQLFLSERTVSKHVENIFYKVNVSTKMELLAKLGALPAI